MSIAPQPRAMSKQYTAVLAVVYLALAGFMAYRGYQQNNKMFYIFAGILVLAVVIRVVRARSVAQSLAAAQAKSPDQKVDLFTKPKDY